MLVAELLLKKRGVKSPAFASAVLCTLSLLTLFVVAISAAAMFAEGSSVAFNAARPFVRLDRFANFAIALVAVGSGLSCLLSDYYLRELKIDHGEYYALVLLATSGMILLVSAVDLIAVFLGIELLSIPIYVLAGFDRRKLRSNEAALKYFLVGSFASAILLYGMALLYGATGSTDFGAIRQAFDRDASRSPRSASRWSRSGFTFKISAVPFHMWTPDVYEGAPTSVTAFMSVTVKAAAFAALMRIARVRLRRRRAAAARRLLVAGRRDDDRRQRDGGDPGEREAHARVLERRARRLPAGRARGGHAGRLVRDAVLPARLRVHEPRRLRRDHRAHPARAGRRPASKTSRASRARARRSPR